MIVYLIFLASCVYSYNAQRDSHTFTTQNTHVILLKDVYVDCHGKKGHGDVVTAMRMCKQEPRCALFVLYNGQITICNNTSEPKPTATSSRKGAWIGVKSEIVDIMSDGVPPGRDLICDATLNTWNTANSGFENLVDSETATKLDLHALGIMPQNCKQYKEGSDEILPDKGALNEKPRPTVPKAKTMQCGINGSIRPDDYHEKYYAGDIVPMHFSEVRNPN